MGFALLLVGKKIINKNIMHKLNCYKKTEKTRG